MKFHPHKIFGQFCNIVGMIYTKSRPCQLVIFKGFLILTRVVIHIINMAFLKADSGRYGIESLENMILSSFNFLSGGNGRQRILGIQLGSTGTMDLNQSRL